MIIQTPVIPTPQMLSLNEKELDEYNSAIDCIAFELRFYRPYLSGSTIEFPLYKHPFLSDNSRKAVISELNSRGWSVTIKSDKNAETVFMGPMKD